MCNTYEKSVNAISSFFFTEQDKRKGEGVNLYPTLMNTFGTPYD